MKKSDGHDGVKRRYGGEAVDRSPFTVSRNDMTVGATPVVLFIPAIATSHQIQKRYVKNE